MQDCSYIHSTDKLSYTSVLWGDSQPSQEAGHLGSLAAEETLPLAMTLNLPGLALYQRHGHYLWDGQTCLLPLKGKEC